MNQNEQRAAPFVADSSLTNRWERFASMTRVIAEHEGADVAQIWVVAKLFRRIMPIVGMRMTIGAAAHEWTTRDEAMLWVHLKQVALERLREIPEASIYLADFDVQSLLERNRAGLSDIIGEAETYLAGLDADTIRSAVYQAGFRKQLATTEKMLSSEGKRPQTRRGLRRRPPATYAEQWQLEGMSSAREYMQETLLPRCLELITQREMPRVPPGLASALEHWRRDLTSSLLALEA